MTGPTPDPLMMRWLNSHSQNNPRHSKCHIRFVSKDCSDRSRSHTGNAVLIVLVDLLTVLSIMLHYTKHIFGKRRQRIDSGCNHVDLELFSPYIIISRAHKIVQETKTWLVLYISPLNTVKRNNFDIYTGCTETLDSKHDIPPLQMSLFLWSHVFLDDKFLTLPLASDAVVHSCKMVSSRSYPHLNWLGKGRIPTWTITDK